MKRGELFVNVSPGETRLAFLRNGHLSELEIDRGPEQSILNNIYLGRIRKVAPGLKAAFVDIGVDKEGFLGLPEVHVAGSEIPADARVGDYLNEGDAVLVQVLRDAMDDKGPKLTMKVSLPGADLVFRPAQEGIHLSRQIREETERTRLAAIFERHGHEEESFIVRSAAAGKSEGSLAHGISLLRQQWRLVERSRSEGKAPACVYREPDPVCRFIRDTAGRSLERIVIDDAGVFEEVRKYCETFVPEALESLEYFSEPAPLFDLQNIEEEIDKALSPRIHLPGGARIQIEPTAALTAIDVDSGQASQSGSGEDLALGANLEAAGEIARQIRLRNIAGHIVVDFIPMKRRDNRERVLGELRKQVSWDSSPTFLAGFTRLGKVELTRQRRRNSLADLMLEAYREGDFYQRPKSVTSIAFEALRRLMYEGRTNPGKNLELRAGPAVVAILRDGVAKKALAELNESMGRNVKLTARDDFADGHFEVVARHGGEDRER